jgi:AbrB family looped-hinge helix DNA binding protein
MELSMESALTRKGQATIPKAVREHLGLRPGDRVRFFLHPDGGVALLPVVPVSRLKGIASRPGQRTATIEEMNEAIADVAAERDGRSRR